MPRSILVVEGAPRWAVLLRRFAPQFQVLEARSLALAEDLLSQNGQQFVLLAPSSMNHAAALARLSTWQRQYSAATFVVVLQPLDSTTDLGFREAGAQLVIHDWRELPQLISMAARYNRRLSTRATRP